ncbi:TIGR00341 family protein [Halogeometricum luteum]|uniref:TIGR00341 family protein n=1 Tax=Halogeometricum luteum TaxID=2950537 RepID=A0ABU2FZN2_9EURY|nr:TIGR00341 family protein [Halogeometricum sp. S3BR5-2]MDS0293995.1 TIGR00341 family protein [Halogeometricum sp. S3BR5-2]
MRLVQVMVPTGKRDTILQTLDEEGIDYAVSDETSGRGYTALVSFPLPAQAVEPVLEELREVGIERDAYTVVVDAETVVSKRFQDLEEKYEEENGDSDRIAREELAANANELAPPFPSFLLMTIVSAVVATAGVLLDSPAVVVGSMVIAPLVGPAMSASVGTVIDDREMALQGIKLQAIGVAVAIAAAAVFATLLRVLGIVPMTAEEVFALGEVHERLAPDVLSLVIALGAGAAGAAAISSGVSAALVGVMIAAALVPPIAVVGVALAWGHPVAMLGPFVLVLVNILSINFVALMVLWQMGYRPQLWFREDEARSATVSRVATIGAILLLLSSVLVGVSYGTYRTTTFEQDAQSAIVSELPEDASLVSMNVEYEGFPFQTPSRVVVTVGYPPGGNPPVLGDDIRPVIDELAPEPLGPLGSRDVTVEVRYIAVDDP